MAYKKYIQRNGKLYGPYIYQSKRVDGKVVSEYYGSEGVKKDESVKKILGASVGSGNKNYKKIFFIFIGVLVLAFLVYLFAFSNSKIQSNKLTGGVVLGLDTTYKSGKPLGGVLKFSLKEGELIPASSKIVFDNSGKTYEFPLSEVLKENPSSGNYYFEGKDIYGSGLGYGVEGERTLYPEVQFSLQIYSEGNVEETSNESSPVEEIGETTSSDNVTEENGSSPITGAVVKSSGGFFSSLFGLTGNVVSMELEKEVSGVTAKDKPFIYELKDGETAELVPKSVTIDNQGVADNLVSLEVKDNKVTVTTDYSKTEKGYGKEYSGEKEETISLDLSSLNLILEEGNLDVKLVYGNEDMLTISTSLKEGEETSGEIVDTIEQPTEENESNEILIEDNQTVQEIVNSSVWDIGDFLTPQEKNVLSNEFGNASLNSVKSEMFNGRIIRGYEYGGYYVEYSYDSSLNKDVLNVQMERDRIKFLKDIANSISKKESLPQNLEGYNENYTI